MNTRIKLGAFIGALVVLGGMAFGIAKTLSDGEEQQVRNAGAPSAPGGEADGHGQSMAGVHDPAGGFRVVMNKIDFQPGIAQDIEFQIKRGGEVVRDFEIESERRLHLIVVRHDLSGFQHLHPELDDDGTWRTQIKFAAAGPHRAYADFQVAGERQTVPFDLKALGEYDPQTTPDPQRIARVGEYAVTQRASGEAGSRKFEFEVTRKGRPVRDLQDYLGSKGHLVAINLRTLDYTHVHPVGARGNQVAFEADLARGGGFRLFFQFLHEGEVRTAPFTVRSVAEARVDGDSASGDHGTDRPRESEDHNGGSEHPQGHGSGGGH